MVAMELEPMVWVSPKGPGRRGATLESPVGSIACHGGNPLNHAGGGRFNEPHASQIKVDRHDPHYWFYVNLEDPNERGYDVIRRLFLNEIVETRDRIK